MNFIKLEATPAISSGYGSRVWLHFQTTSMDRHELWGFMSEPGVQAVQKFLDQQSYWGGADKKEVDDQSCAVTMLAWEVSALDSVLQGVIDLLNQHNVCYTIGSSLKVTVR